MAKKQTSVDSERLHYAGLALLAEQAENYEDAAMQWRRAASASLERGSVVLYEEAAKRCERKSKEKSDKVDSKSVGN